MLQPRVLTGRMCSHQSVNVYLIAKQHLNVETLGHYYAQRIKLPGAPVRARTATSRHLGSVSNTSELSSIREPLPR